MMIQSIANKDSLETLILKLGLDLGTISDAGSFPEGVEALLVFDALLGTPETVE